MKKLFALVLTALLISSGIFAQDSWPKAYLNGFVGYTFDESFYAGYGEWKYVGNVHYGGSVEFVLQGASTRYSERTIELMYQYMNSDLQNVYIGGSKAKGANMNVNYLTIGGNNYFGQSRKIMGFGGLQLGAGFVNGTATDANSKSYSESTTKFAFNLRGGGRFMFSDKVGLKLYAQLNTLVGGTGFYFGTGGAGVSTYSSAVQFGLGGGLTIGLGAKPAPATTPNP